MLNIAVTFDYELFLGNNNASDTEILFDPSERLMTLLGKYKMTSTFFADVCSVAAHRKFGLASYADKFELQLADMLKRGHDVQLHLHPNWLLSEYKEGKWNIDTTHYTLHSFGFDTFNELNAPGIIHAGKVYLETLLRKTDENYKCIAYRAGGYSVQPHGELFRALSKEGILIDSSVCSHQYSDSDTIKYDFRNLPRKLNWWIDPDDDFTSCGNQNCFGLFEVPMPSDRNKLLRRLVNKDYSRGVRRTKQKGDFISMTGSANVNQEGRISQIINYGKRYMRLSFDCMNRKRMLAFLNELERRHKSENAYISIICHPKLADDGVLANMESVLYSIAGNKNFNIVNMRDIYDRLIIDKGE